MTESIKILYDIDFYELTRNIEDMGRYFAITKNFSLKANGHFKMLAHLINNLVDSEDYLDLTEETLRVKNSKKIQNAKTEINENTIKSVKSEKNEEEKLVDKIIEKFQSENNKLWEVLQKGENQSKNLKDYFEKILNSIKKGDKEILTNPKIINNYNYRDHSDMTKNGKDYKIDIKLKNPQSHNFRENESSSYIEPFNNKQFRSTYNGMTQNYEEYLMSQSQADKNLNSSQSLKYELGKMTKEIQDLKLAKENEEGGLKEIVKKMIEVKTENELALKEKENEIKFLRSKLDELKDKLSDFEDEIKELKKENKELEVEKKKFFKNQNGVFNEAKKNKDQLEFRKLNKENRELKKQLKNLESKNSKKTNKNSENFYQIKYNNLKDEFIKLEKDKSELEEKNERLCVIFEKNMENVNINLIDNNINNKQSSNKRDIDIFKCLFLQCKYIDDQEQDLRNSNSEFDEDEEINESVVIDL